MNLRQLRPNLWLTELVLNEFDVRGAVVVGEARVLVWDTLSHPRDMQPVAALAGDKPIYVVYSHADWDHCWGTAGLKAAEIIAHDTCAARFQSGELAEGLAKKQTQEPGTWDAVRLRSPVVTFSQSLSVDLGGVIVELYYLPGHTEDCLVAWIPQLGTLLAGDTIETPLPYLSEKSPALLPRWLSELEHWQTDSRVQAVVPAHGEIGDRALIARTSGYLRDLRDGNAPTVPAQMTPFYTETHANNRKLVQSARL